ncbi:hypothetical protein RHSIM_Rhsim13G0057300 [Rhododendron simsii]|uniref:Uncharacterized protein n=1 Tax=Rhododendron simsii TaxID=118357 RepID=A0A834L5T7_RHOSS|nr:hypothetical protein RHSIM_Rhsim13G0057300 [Rhododendron simsii]
MEVVLERKDADDWIYRGEWAANLVLDYSGSSPTFATTAMGCLFEAFAKEAKGANDLRPTSLCIVAHISLLEEPITNGRLDVCGGLAKRRKSTNLVVSGPRNLFQDLDLIPEPSSEAGSNFQLIPHVVLPFWGIISCGFNSFRKENRVQMQGDHLLKLGRDDCDSTKSFSPGKPKPDRCNLTYMEGRKAWKPSNNFVSMQCGVSMASTTLLAEKAQLAQENSVFAQENHFGAS